MSTYKMDSVGIAVTDITTGNNILTVFPVEYLSEYSGVLEGIDGDTLVDKATTVIKSGNSLLSGSAIKQYTIEAEWRGDGGNRVTPPNIKKGETVRLYKVGQANKWYWEAGKYESDLRRKETVVHVYGNTDTHGETLNNENSYYTVIDTVNKRLHIHTSMNDGEVTTFDITLDTMKGILEVVDGNKNYIRHNAKDGTLETNHTKQVTIHAPKIVLDGEVYTTKNVYVEKTINAKQNINTKADVTDRLGNLTTHKHSVVGHSTAIPR